MYGAFVRAVREAGRLTQREVAEISGVQQSNISAIETGRRAPSADTLNRLLVSCGFELSATAGDRIIYCPLPRAGWFSDEDLPDRTADDPVDEGPSVSAGIPIDDRAAIVTAVLEAADAAGR